MSVDGNPPIASSRLLRDGLSPGGKGREMKQLVIIAAALAALVRSRPLYARKRWTIFLGGWKRRMRISAPRMQSPRGRKLRGATQGSLKPRRLRPSERE